MHLAHGRRPTRVCGGLNRSGLHWDLVCDLRRDGRGDRRRPRHLRATARFLPELTARVSAALRLGAHRLPLGGRTLVMGIVNDTPDSFYDRGAHFGTAAVHRARAGADRRRRGHASTSAARRARWAARWTAAEEIERVAPVIAGVAALGVPRLGRHVPAPRSPTPRWRPARCSSTTTRASATPICRASPPRAARASWPRTTAAGRAPTPRAATTSRWTRSRSSWRRGASRPSRRASRRTRSCSTRASASARRRPRTSRCCATCARLRALGAPVLAACSHKEFTADATGLDGARPARHAGRRGAGGAGRRRRCCACTTSPRSGRCWRWPRPCATRPRRP